MKVSKLRAKARSAFGRPRRIQWRDDRGFIHDHDERPQEGVTVEVVVIRGRQFTRPQAAKQRD